HVLGVDLRVFQRLARRGDLVGGGLLVRADDPALLRAAEGVVRPPRHLLGDDRIVVLLACRAAGDAAVGVGLSFFLPAQQSFDEVRRPILVATDVRRKGPADAEDAHCLDGAHALSRTLSMASRTPLSMSSTFPSRLSSTSCSSRPVPRGKRTNTSRSPGAVS